MFYVKHPRALPLLLFPTPLGAAAPGLDERRKVAGEGGREGLRDEGAGVARTEAGTGTEAGAGRAA